MRATISDLVAGIEPIDAIEREHQIQTLAWIDSGAALCRIAKPATPPQHLVAYFTLVDLVRGSLLLVDHKNAGLWLPTGGHVEPGEHPDTTVSRELQEELCIPAKFVFPRPIFLTIAQTIGSTAGHTDVSLWYALQGSSQQQLHFDHTEFNEIAWFPLDGVPTERTDPNLSRYIAKLRRCLAVDSIAFHTAHR